MILLSGIVSGFNTVNKTLLSTIIMTGLKECKIGDECNNYRSVIRVYNYFHQAGIIFNMVYLSACLLVGLCKYYWLELHKKSEDGSCPNYIPINFG